MRVRNRKGATELLEANPHYVVLNPVDAKGKWREIFGNDHPIHVEVGSGKGAFITGMAKANPDINYIGIDIQKSVLSYALDKVLEADVPNIKLLWVDGSELTNYFADGEIDRLYLNFSDPWPSSKFCQKKVKSTSRRTIVACSNTAWSAFRSMAWFSKVFGWIFMPVTLKAMS